MGHGMGMGLTYIWFMDLEKLSTTEIQFLSSGFYYCLLKIHAVTFKARIATMDWSTLFSIHKLQNRYIFSEIVW